MHEFVATTGYQRKHASTRLAGKRQWRDPPEPIRRAPRALDTTEDQPALLRLVELFAAIGSQRLRLALENELANLRRNGDLKISRRAAQPLQHVRPSRMDRWRRAVRPPGQKRCGGTKPGTLRKHQIPMRTFAEGDDPQPGFGEIALVQHAGGKNKGAFA